ncbi:phosphopantetheine-binding protein [Streptomyces luomodiensis]|uniref:Phosphopantetheine-binding protein n=1 Tax=Streptomyces luomodiensis TaxID=3026192 RepID=A0ABY9UXS7_9ACTN|nr:phosphopantetheine-binding protein [Streptomyces sp. SCA4-21]WNE95275.1 phosphopantetheine-binding protein [Streptomyces sp. SCA4-21]
MPTTPVTREAVSAFVTEALADFGADPDAITMDATFEDLEIDSLDLVELGQAVKKTFGIHVRPKDMDDVKTVGEALDAMLATAGL